MLLSSEVRVNLLPSSKSFKADFAQNFAILLGITIVYISVFFKDS